MKTRDSQAGSAHLLIIVALVIVILGGLGYVGYTSFMKRQAAATPTQISTNTVAAPSATTREVMFENWNVAINVPNASNLYTASAASADTPSYDGYYVYDVDFDRACVLDQYRSLGVITRVKADSQVDTYITDEAVTNRQYFTEHSSGAVILGDYVYYFTKPNGSYSCTDPSSKTGAAASDALGKARTTLLDAISSLHSTTK